MVTGLLDSSVLIDVLRGYEPAQTWLSQQGRLGTTRIIWLELVEGAPNKRALYRALQLLHSFELVDITNEDMQWALDQLVHLRLSHNTGAFDCTAQGRRGENGGDGLALISILK